MKGIKALPKFAERLILGAAISMIIGPCAITVVYGIYLIAEHLQMMDAALLLAACIAPIIWHYTGMGPLDIIIGALLHFQAALLGVRVELYRALRRAIRQHPARLAALKQLYAGIR